MRKSKEVENLGGPKTTPKTEKFIVRIWMNLKSDGGNPSANEVLAAAEAYIKANNIKDIFPPKIRKVQQILRQHLKNEKELPSEQIIMKQPWSMATLKDYPLPAESIPAVMRVWRYAIVTGETLTIRQAKWVSRLYGFRNDLRIPDEARLLWLSAYEYAKKEEASLVSKRQIDTLNDDIRFIFTPLEALTIWKTIYGNEPFADPFITSLPYADDGGVMEEVLHPVDYYNALYNNAVSNDRDKELHSLIAKQPSWDSELISLEMMVLYLIWITHIKRRPEWPSISADQALNVILKLREWVKKQEATKYNLEQAGQTRNIGKIKDNKVFIEGLPLPQEVLNLLSQYSVKGG